MPLLEFRCQQCGRQFESLQRRDERTMCPDCASERLERLMSAPAAHSSGRSSMLPLASGCPPMNAPPCGPGCCRLPMQ
jgi:putative FmdB family regulatory protein